MSSISIDQLLPPVLTLHPVVAGSPSYGFCIVPVKVPAWILALRDLACLRVLL